MTDELPEWDFTPTPVAGRDGCVREALLSYCCDNLDPLLRLVQATTTRDNVVEVLMAFCKIYKADTYAAQGRDLTILRLERDLEIDLDNAPGEFS